MKQIVFLAGPGFYTGLRIAYGIAQVLKLDGTVAKGFYAYDVPRILGVKDYTWVTKAYRGEVFVYKSLTEESLLISESAFLAGEIGGDVYIHHRNALDEKIAAKIPNAKETESLIMANMGKVLASLENQSEPLLHYFRAPEEEFKPSV